MLKEALKNVSTVAIGGHIRPDGDCVGSAIGVYQYIKTWYPEIEVSVYLEDIPESFRFVKATENIQSEIDADKVYDLFIALDCGDVGRLGFSGELFAHAKHTICIDHHVSNGAFADENYIEADASSTSELVYRQMDPEKITKEIAECLYLGIVHDTGVFQYSCTAPSTMEAAAELMRKGIDASRIIHDTFYEKTYAQNQILGRALLTSFLFMDGKCIVSVIDKEQMEFYGVVPKDLEGIVSQLRLTEGVEVAIFMYELNTHEYKVSLRSGDVVDVSRVASAFGGGGHKKAAGLTMNGSRHDVINNIAKEIACQMQNE